MPSIDDLLGLLGLGSQDTVPDQTGLLGNALYMGPVGTSRVGGDTQLTMPSPDVSPVVGTLGGNPVTAAMNANAYRLAGNMAQFSPADVAALRIPRIGGGTLSIDVRGPGNEPLDVRPGVAKAVNQMYREHASDPNAVGLAGLDPNVTNVTLPPGVTSAADIGARTQQAVQQATQMTQGIAPGSSPPRYWYKEGAEAFHGATGEDLEATERLAAAHAITSPMTDVAGNANKAVNAWNQAIFGGPITDSMAPQNAALEEALYGSSLPDSRKTGAFFDNHMRYLDPAVANKVTNDIWAMRGMGYTGPGGKPYAGTPTVGKDNYVRMMVDRVSDRLNAEGVDGGGWTPDQVQAALWVHAQSSAQTGTPSPNSFNFKNGLERLTAAQSNAHDAGPTLLGGAVDDPQAQQAWRQAASGLLTDASGRDIVNASLGMLTPRDTPGGGVVSMTATGIKPSSRALMDAGTLIRGTLLRQPSVLWEAHPDVAGLPPIAQANVVHALGADPLDVKAVLDAAGGGLEGAVTSPSPAGTRILNVGERTNMSNPQFQAAAKDAINKAGLTGVDLQRARADYGYFTHDWTRDPTGKGYIDALGGLPPNLQRVGDQLFARLGGRLDAAASSVFGGSRQVSPWGTPGFGQAVGPELSLPQRPWVMRPGPNEPGSVLPGLLQ